VREIAATYERRRDVLVRGLHEAGWAVENPKASMYVWAPIPERYRAMGSLEFAKRLLAEAKVSVSPGIGFGEFGDGHVRFAMIENEARTRQAIRGIKQMLRNDAARDFCADARDARAVPAVAPDAAPQGDVARAATIGDDVLGPAVARLASSRR
jgi:hypothetical protein